jgi:hypothetical protein
MLKTIYIVAMSICLIALSICLPFAGVKWDFTKIATIIILNIAGWGAVYIVKNKFK